MKLDDFDYDLPAELIAQWPTPRREDSRLMILQRESGNVDHDRFAHIGAFLRQGDVLVLNDTRVIPARVFAKRPTGGRVEVLFLEELESREWLCLLSARGKVQPGEVLNLADGFEIRLKRRTEDGLWQAQPLFNDVESFLEREGLVPLPPYITRQPQAEDRLRYQTVYAREKGAVAAPTAGLHFTKAVLAKLAESGVEVATLTLHVGIGTFRPIRCRDIEDHRMHEERYIVPQETAQAVARAKSGGRRVVAVGTTTVRALEATAPSTLAGEGSVGSTDLFIRPPYRFRVVDALVTNFHLPRSTLLVMVSAFAGREKLLAAYEEATRLGYRFYSYGDVMFIF